MSADNGYIIRKNSRGKYVLQMYFASNDTYPEVDEREEAGFDTLESAVLKYEEMEDEEGYLCEYGLTINVTKKQCKLCGPGYYLGDEGCRHS